MPRKPGETLDALFHGKIKVIQKKSGYRFSVDAVILAHFPNFKRRDVIVDLGCGCGIIPLIIACRMPQVRLFGVELQDELSDLAMRNVTLNGLDDRIAVKHGDFKKPGEILPAAFADWVISNPPYGRLLSGRMSPKEEKALARHEIETSLLDVIMAARYYLRPHGRAAVIYPARRAAGLITAMRQMALEPKRMQIVQSYSKSEGKFVLVEAVKDGGEELKILPPFFIYDRPQKYSLEMERLYEDWVERG